MEAAVGDGSRWWWLQLRSSRWWWLQLRSSKMMVVAAVEEQQMVVSRMMVEAASLVTATNGELQVSATGELQLRGSRWRKLS